MSVSRRPPQAAARSSGKSKPPGGSEYVAGFVRERLSRQAVRRYDCDSLLWFVPREELERWPVRKWERVERAWTWDGTQWIAT